MRKKCRSLFGDLKNKFCYRKKNAKTKASGDSNKVDSTNAFNEQFASLTRPIKILDLDFCRISGLAQIGGRENNKNTFGSTTHRKSNTIKNA